MTMMRLTALIISFALLATAAWAGDVGYTVPEEITQYICTYNTDDPKPASPYVRRDELRSGCFKDYQPTAELLFDSGVSTALYPGVISDDALPTKDIADILQRCLEFVRDGDANYLENIPTCTTLLYVPPYRTLKNDAEEEVSKAEIAQGRLERETALRREIENAIQILKGEK